MLGVWINRYATPLTTGLFLVSLVSGVAIFFHLGNAVFHGMHEWLSMVLLVPFVLHVKKNWSPLTMYLKRGWLLWPLSLSLIAALAFAVPALTGTGGRGGDPMMAVGSLVTSSTISSVAPLFKGSPEALSARLLSAGYKVTSINDTLDQIAKSSNADSRAILATLLSP